MFAMTSGTTNRPKTIPVTARVAQRLSRRLDDLGHPGLRRPSAIIHKGLKPILQLASDWRESFTPGRHPLRRDHRPDGPHAEPA